MIVDLQQIVSDFARAFKEVDSTKPVGSSSSRKYQPGIGPLSEANAIAKAVAHLTSLYPSIYGEAASRQYPGIRSRQSCDLVIPGNWAIEFKLIRPFGDNGLEAEHWSENILHPYPGNTSSLGDGLKLRGSGFAERKAIIVFGYEHTPAVISLEMAVAAFEVIASQIVGLRLSERYQASFSDLIHPVHQQGTVYCWEVLEQGLAG